jgi:uncharacterized membrane protein YuzA (DUF378 family)
MSKEEQMKIFNLVTLILTIIAGLNVGILGLADFDVLAAIFGGTAGVVTRIVFVILGLCALWQLVPFFQAINSSEITAERHV